VRRSPSSPPRPPWSPPPPISKWRARSLKTSEVGRPEDLAHASCTQSEGLIDGVEVQVRDQLTSTCFVIINLPSQGFTQTGRIALVLGRRFSKEQNLAAPLPILLQYSIACIMLSAWIGRTSRQSGWLATWCCRGDNASSADEEKANEGRTGAQDRSNIVKTNTFARTQLRHALRTPPALGQPHELRVISGPSHPEWWDARSKICCGKNAREVMRNLAAKKQEFLKPLSPPARRVSGTSRKTPAGLLRSSGSLALLRLLYRTYQQSYPRLEHTCGSSQS